MSAAIRKGDSVAVEYAGTVTVDPRGSNFVYIRAADEGVYYAPLDAVTVTKRAVPTEPPVGAFISYTDHAGTRDYRRESNLWVRVVPSLYATPLRWELFNHAKVFVYNKASVPLA